MIQKILSHRPTSLLLLLASFFVANALIAECIGTKIFSLERLFGREPQPFSLFGQDGLTYSLTCGVLLWPIEFIMTDIVNEYYGPKTVRRISYIAVGLITYAFIMFFMAIGVPADQSFWTGSQVTNGIPNMQDAFSAIFGQGMWIILGSLVAFLVSQLLDAWIFQKLKKATGGKNVWLRATGSTIVSQLVDSFIVLFIAFGKSWGWQRVIAIGLVNYSYKFTMAVVLTPVIYLIEGRIEAYLGRETTKALKEATFTQE